MRDPLPVELDRWAAAHLISTDQAQAILSAEAIRTEGASSTESHPAPPTAAPAPVSHRRAVVAEVLGSLGAITAGVAAVVGTAVLWSQLTTAARIAIPAIGAVAAVAAGAAVPRGGDRSSERLGALLWLLAVAAVAATVAIVSTEVLELAVQNVVLLSGAISFALSLVLLTRSRTPHLVLAVVGSAAATVVGVMLQYDSAQPEHIGAVLLCLGCGVILLGWSDVLPDRSTAIVAGAAVALVGSEMLSELADHWPIIALGAVALGLLVMYVASRDRVTLVAGLILALVTVVQGIIRLAGNDGGGTGGNRWVVLLVFAIGAGVLTASIVAIRSSNRPRRSL